MKSQRPYLLRALFDWILDSGETPYILVDATFDEVRVPTEHVKDGKIVLNISPNAVRELEMDNDYVACSSRFSGKDFPIYLPIASVKAIYCKDSGVGMAFDDKTPQLQSEDATSAESESEEPQSEEKKTHGSSSPSGPKLRLV